MTSPFPACACGGELAPPLLVVLSATVIIDESTGHPITPALRWSPRITPAVTDAEEAAANAYEDAAIVQCRKCGTRVVLHAERPERFRKNQPKADQTVFDVTQGDSSK